MSKSIPECVFEIIEKNLRRMSPDQKLKIRDKINHGIIREREISEWMFQEPSRFIQRQFRDVKTKLLCF